MKLGSLFDGSGGFPLAGAMCGIEPAYASEVEPYPIAVTRSRFPYMVHLGSVTEVNGADIEPCDVITFGSPCQDMSVAGKRAGLKHEDMGDDETTRSGLFHEAVRIIKEMREKTNGQRPTFAVWENVPGAFSSNRGSDFRCVLEEFIKIVEPEAVMPPIPKGGWAYADCYVGDGWSIAYRTFDVQYIRTAQRRRRIYLVLDLRGERAGEILFERESLRRYFAESTETKEEASADVRGCSATDDREGKGAVGFPLGFRPENVRLYDERSTTLCNGTRPGFTVGVIEKRNCEGFDVYNQALTGDKTMTVTGASTDPHHIPCTVYSVENYPMDSRVNVDDSGKVQTLTSRMGTGGGNVPMVIEPKVYGISSYDSNGMRSENPNSGFYEAETSRTLDLNGGNPACNQGGMAIVEPVEPKVSLMDAYQHHGYCIADSGGFKSHNSEAARSDGFEIGLSPTLTAGKHDACCVIALDRASFNQGENAKYDFEISDSGKNSTLVAKGPSAVCYVDTTHADDVVRLDNVTAPLQARDYKGGKLVQQEYIVRRLTPTECARLQGFPDRWGNIDKKDSFTDEEYAFWFNVRKTDAEINGKQVKDWTRKQMLTWYNKLHTDSAEYKMWGNGIALPCALYVMEGIADALEKERTASAMTSLS